MVVRTAIENEIYVMGTSYKARTDGRNYGDKARAPLDCDLSQSTLCHLLKTTHLMCEEGRLLVSLEHQA